MGYPVSRSQPNVLNTGFHLKFVERVYDGSPRWWSDDWTVFTSTPKGKYGRRLDREPGVTNLIRLAYDYEKKFFSNSVPNLATCVNPDCPLRSWFMVEWSAMEEKVGFKLNCWEVLNEYQSISGFETEYTTSKQDEIHSGRPLMASGRMDELRSQCPHCNKKRPVFGLSTIKNKWIYVLKEKDGSLAPHLEIEIAESSVGLIHSHFTKGSFTDKAQPFDGSLILDQITKHTWHFFLSPVRLGPKALELLIKSPMQDPFYAFSRIQLKPWDWKVGVNAELQPWTTTVKRRFQSRQLRTPYEYIPLVDAFSWVAQIAEFDYYPIVSAQQKLVQDSDEQAKSFVAATLAQVVGRQKVSDNPPKFENDQWDVKDDTVEIPQYKLRASPDRNGSRPNNIAEAWVDRYHATLQFLTEEANCACSRVFFPVRFSLAHRIIELACQENKTDPTFLAFGLMHWAHILKELLICQAGQAFTTWLVKNKEAADRIPQRNVLGGEGLEPGSKLAKGIGQGLPVHILAYLSPVIIAETNKPAEDLSKYLANIGVKASELGIKDIQAVKDLSVDFKGMHVDHYTEKLPTELDASEFRKANKLSSWKARIESFGTIGQVEKIMSLLSALSEYGKKGGHYQTEWERYGKAKEKIETPIKVAQFLTEQTHKLIKAGINVETSNAHLLFEKQLVEKVEKQGIRALGAIELEMLSASRSLSAFKAVGLGVRLLAGPVGLVLGGCELAIQFGHMGKSMESGDPGAAVAHGIQAVAATLIIAVAGAECVALVTGAGAVAWAGPVGWIAAGLMLIGSIVMAFCAKNDLELYARHCFLGEDWGKGGSDTTGKSWMATLGWAHLKSNKNAGLALLRLLSGFSTWISPAIESGFQIRPSYVPAGAYFRVQVVLTPRGQTNPKETYNVKIWLRPSGMVDYAWIGTEPHYSSSIYTVWEDSQVAGIRVRVNPAGFSGSNIRFRVKLCYDSREFDGLPAIADWVENSNIDMGGIYHTVSSSEADAEAESLMAEAEAKRLAEEWVKNMNMFGNN